MKKAMSVAVCGIIAALSVLMLFLGGLSFILAYAMPMLVGVLMIMLRRTFSVCAAWLTYAAVCALSLMLVNDKECMLMYILFFGYYPIIYDSFNKFTFKPFKYILKFLLFNIATAAVQLLLVFVFGIPFLEEGEAQWFIVLFAVLMNIIFVFYDRIIGKLYFIYEIKLEKRIKRYFKA